MLGFTGEVNSPIKEVEELTSNTGGSRNPTLSNVYSRGEVYSREMFSRERSQTERKKKKERSINRMSYLS